MMNLWAIFYFILQNKIYEKSSFKLSLHFKKLIKDLAKSQLNVSIVNIHLKNWR